MKREDLKETILDNKKKIIAIGIIGVLAVAFISWTVIGIFYGEELLEEEELVNVKIGGSTTCFPIIIYEVEQFEDDHDEFDISVAGVGSRLGVQGVINNVYDIGMSSSTPSKYDPDGWTQWTPFCNDGVIICFSAASPLLKSTPPQFTMNMIRWLYNSSHSGATWNDFLTECTNRGWGDPNINGANEQIVAIGRDSNSGTREAFEKLTEIDDFGAPAYDQEIASNGALKASLTSNSYAVGYLGWPYKDSSVEYADVAGHGDPVGLTVEPTDASIKDHSYPLTRYLYLVWDKGADLKDDIYDIIDFILSEDGQYFAAVAGAVPL